MHFERQFYSKFSTFSLTISSKLFATYYLLRKVRKTKSACTSSLPLQPSRSRTSNTARRLHYLTCKLDCFYTRLVSPNSRTLYCNLCILVSSTSPYRMVSRVSTSSPSTSSRLTSGNSRASSYCPLSRLR